MIYYTGKIYYIKSSILHFQTNRLTQIDMSDIENKCLISLIQDRDENEYYIYILKYKTDPYKNIIIAYNEERKEHYQLNMGDFYKLLLESHMKLTMGEFLTDDKYETDITNYLNNYYLKLYKQSTSIYERKRNGQKPN